jgi:hypothetical protein
MAAQPRNSYDDAPPVQAPPFGPDRIPDPMPERDEPAPIGEPPCFAVGDRVVHRDCPDAVIEVLATYLGGSRVRAGRSEADYRIAAAAGFVPVPEGYVDPPAEPLGGAALGLSHAAWESKRKSDEADQDYQRRLCRYHRAMLGWAAEHAARVNPEAAAELTRTHKFLLDRAVIRAAGQDPDAPSARAA